MCRRISGGGEKRKTSMSKKGPRRPVTWCSDLHGGEEGGGINERGETRPIHRGDFGADRTVIWLPRTIKGRYGPENFVQRTLTSRLKRKKIMTLGSERRFAVQKIVGGGVKGEAANVKLYPASSRWA